ncbi:MAG: ATP-grasp domain-containing protein [Xanthomonadales bacterium]|nr:ATP-grasp domain-containing protein [Xanthomonadales bacterium]
MKILLLNIWQDFPFNRNLLNDEEHEIWHVCDPNGLRYVRNYVSEDEVSGITLPTGEDPRELLMALQSVYREFPFERVVALDERTVLPAAYIRDVFNIPGPRVAEVEPFRNKRTMKEILAKKGIRVIRDLDPSTFESGAFTPCVIKKIDGTASGGVHLCPTLADYEKHRGDLAHGSLFEEFVEGDIFHVDGAFKATGIVSMPHAYISTCYHHYVLGQPVGSVGMEESPLKQRLNQFAHEVIAALPLREGIFHMEIIRTADDELIFLEVACRIGGGEVYRNFADVYNFNLLEFSIQSQLGLDPPLRELRQDTIAGWLMINNVDHVPGIFTGVHCDPLALDNCMYSMWQPRIGRKYESREQGFVKFSLRGKTSSEVSTSILELMDKIKLNSVPLPDAEKLT